MPSNSKNIAELLNTDTTVQITDVADGAITTAKLAADAVTSAKLADNAVVTANIVDGNVTAVKTTGVSKGKNLLINGGMLVDQRNATMQFSASSGYPCDRWYVGTSASGTFQYTQSTDAPAGFGNSMKIQCTTADTSLDAGSYNYIMHKLEGNALQSMNSTNGIVEHTISFYAKSSKTGVYTVNIRDEDNGQGNSKSFTVSNANTWERYTLTFPAHSSGKLDNDNLSSYRIYWWFASGTNQTSGTFYNGTWGAHSNPNRVSSSNVNLGDSTSNNFFITGIQMEVGDSASDFEHRSFAEELQLCQRYFYPVCPKNISGQSIGMAYYYVGTTLLGIVHFPVTMRTAPTITGADVSNYFTTTHNDLMNYLLANRVTTTTLEFYNNSQASGTAMQAVIARSNNAAAFIYATAEL